MTDPTLNTCGERERLVGYLYDELEPGERDRFEEHLGTCAECRVAFDGMREAREQLATWQLPEDAGVGAGTFGWLGLPRANAHERPWWAAGAVAAAAVILLAVGAAIANLEIRYGRDGVTIRTGWSQPPAATQTTASFTPSQSSEARVEAHTVSAEDLTALEKRLRTEFRVLASSAPGPARAAASGNAAPGSSTTNAQLLQRVQDLIDQSEARQRRELAYRVAQVVRDFDTQRQTDLVRIQQGLGQIEGSTAADRQLLNYLVRVSQTPK